MCLDCTYKKSKKKEFNDIHTIVWVESVYDLKPLLSDHLNERKNVIWFQSLHINYIPIFKRFAIISIDGLFIVQNLHSVMISSNRSVFSFDSFSCFSSSVWFGLDGPDDILNPELGDELIGWACCEANDEDKSMEYFLTSAYSTAGDEVELTDSSTKSMERLRRSGGSMLCNLGEATGAWAGIGLVLAYDLEEWRGFTSGGIDEEICRTGGLGGGEKSGDIAASNDFDTGRLRWNSFTTFGCPVDTLKDYQKKFN